MKAYHFICPKCGYDPNPEPNSYPELREAEKATKEKDKQDSIIERLDHICALLEELNMRLVLNARQEKRQINAVST